MVGTWWESACTYCSAESRASLLSHHLLMESSKLYILLFLESKEPLIVIEMFDTASLKYLTTKLYLCLSQDLGMGTGSKC